MERGMNWLPAVAAGLMVLGVDAHGQQAEWPAVELPKLACRGCEHSGRFVEDNPGWGPHLVTIFCTAKNPDSPWQTAQQHVDWAAEPRHSYVADGTGALVIWAHPSDNQFEDIAGLRGLTGIEISHGGDAGGRERLWDRLLVHRLSSGGEPLWGFGADDTHSIKSIDRSWFAARLNELTEKNLKQALRTGNFYVSNGPAISDIQVKDGAVTVTLPQPGDIRWVKAGQYGVGPATVSREAGEDRCVKFEKGVTSSRYALNEEDGTTDAKALFVRCIVTTSQAGKAAFTQPFVIVDKGKLANPYGSAGRWYKGQTHNHSDLREGNEENVRNYYAAYAAKGHTCSFETGYDYWVMPFLPWPAERTPLIERVEPSRLIAGRGGEITIYTKGPVGPRTAILLNGRRVPAKGTPEGRWVARVPADLQPDVYEVTLRDAAPDLQATLQGAVVVQERDADNDGWTTFTPADSKLGSRYTYAVASDGRGGVWVGTNFGLNHFDGKQWKLYRRDKGAEDLVANTCYDVAVEKDGTAWYTCFAGVGLLRPDGTNEQWPSPKIGIPNYQVNQVLRVGDVMYVTAMNRRGLFACKGGKWEQVALPVELAKGTKLTGMALDHQGRIWIGSEGGVLCWDRQKGQAGWKQYTKKNSGLVDDHVSRVTLDGKGRVWLATATRDERPIGGLCCFDGEKWTTYDPQNSPLPERRVWSVFVDRDDNVWAATSKGAACRKADGTWRAYSVLNSGLADNMVTDIGQDSEGNMWFATAGGVSRYSESTRTAETQRAQRKAE